GVRGAADRARGGAARLEHLVVVDSLFVLAGGGPAGTAAGRALRDAGPAAAVEADAEQQLARRDTLAPQLRDRVLAAESGDRDARVAGERGVRGGRPLRRPGAEEVVRHDHVPVDVLRGAAVVGRIDLATGGAVGRDRGGDELVAEPVAQRLHQVTERREAAAVTGQAAGVRVLPVDVDAVEDAGPPRVVDQVVAGVGERGRVLRGLPEAAGPGPAAERPDHLEV